MLEKIVFGCQWLVITTIQLLKWGVITLILLVLIQAIVYRTKKISIYNMLKKSLLK